MHLRESNTQELKARILLVGNVWFSSIRAAAAALSKNVDVTCQIKSNYGLHPEQFIEDTFKDASGGTSITLEDQHPEGADLVIIGYQYNSKIALCFVITKNAGSTKERAM